MRCKQVLEFQATSPVLWISSKLWFSFLSRRLSVLNKVHEKIYRMQPPNYGVISGLFAYLMQSVIFTPPRVNQYVRESLAVLQYTRHCDAFGMFFLDTLDLNNAACLIPEILPADDASVLRFLGPLVRKPRLPIASREGDQEDLSQFPIGETPTWKQITRSLEANPTVLIGKWGGLPAELRGYANPVEGSTEYVAGQIFIRFTRQMWMALHDGWRIDTTFDIAPETIEEALSNWTVDFVLQHCVNPLFMSCNTGLKNVSGRPVPSFAQRWKLYFALEDGEALGKFWSGFAVEPGYIHEFREMMKDVEHKEDLPGCLETLLGQCQCLPDSSRSKSTNRAWHVHQKRMVILTNPDFYSIREVGEKGTVTSKRLDKEQRAAPAHKSQRERMILMLEAAGFTRETASRAVNAQRNAGKRRLRDMGRSKKAKNKRVPPKRRRKEGQEDENAASEEEENPDTEDSGVSDSGESGSSSGSEGDS
jgi:hypothetical protein